jgi:hypothetical protein
MIGHPDRAPSDGVAGMKRGRHSVFPKRDTQAKRRRSITIVAMASLESQ